MRPKKKECAKQMLIVQESNNELSTPTQQAIAQNQQLAESIQQQLDQINETGQASKNQLQQLENSLAKALAQSEQTLTTFAPDFKEAFNLHDIYKYSDNIKGFNTHIYTALQLVDGRVLAAGKNGETRLLQPRFVVRQAQDQ